MARSRAPAVLPGVASEKRPVPARRARLARTHRRADWASTSRLDKRIPLGGGLGGGSSDAATVLVALNELWATGLVDRRTGRDRRSSLGADVPVFVRGHSAWAEGVGETADADRLAAAATTSSSIRACTSRRPACSKPPELTRNSPPTTISGYLSGSGARTTNAFAPVVRARYPQVAAAIDWLGQFGEARLTGSGGCVFVEVESARARRRNRATMSGAISGRIGRAA